MHECIQKSQYKNRQNKVIYLFIMLSEKNTKSHNNNIPKYHTINSYRYRQSDLLGTGYQSHVYKATHLTKKYQVALKTIHVTQISDSIHRELLQSQLASLQALKGTPHIVNLIDVVKTEEYIYVITELCKGDLRVLENSRMEQKEAWRCIKQIIKGYKQLYEKGIVHRDIKPQNMFKKDEGRIKLGDFGFATTLNEAKKQCYYNIGSPSYMPPEVLRRNDYSHSSDIWAIGISYFQLTTGKMPWDGNTQQSILSQISEESILRQIEQCGLSNESKNFLSKVLVYESFKRITPEELFSYQLFQSQPRSILTPKLRSFDKISTSTAETPTITSSRSFGLSSRSFDLVALQNNNEQKLPAHKDETNKIMRTQRHHRRMSYQGNYLRFQSQESACKIPQKVVFSQKKIQQPTSTAFKKKYRGSLDITHNKLSISLNNLHIQRIQKFLQGNIQLIKYLQKSLKRLQQLKQIKQLKIILTELNILKICVKNDIIQRIQKIICIDKEENFSIFEKISIGKDQIAHYVETQLYSTKCQIIKELKCKVEDSLDLRKYSGKAKQQKNKAVFNAAMSIIKLMTNSGWGGKQTMQIILFACNVVEIFGYICKNKYFTSQVILGIVKLNMSTTSINQEIVRKRIQEVEKFK